MKYFILYTVYFLCQIIYNQFVLGQSMAQETILIKIPSASRKLLTQFPQDSRGDFTLVFGKKVYKLQKAYMRLESNFFKKKFTTQSSNLLEITQSFHIQPKVLEQQIFQNVLSCFYGATIQVGRSQVLNYYPVIKFLQVDSLLSELRADMVQNVQHYDLFVLMKIAHQYSQQQIFQTCLQQLQRQNFQQLRYGRKDLFNCPTQLFKLIIKTHNRRKSQGGQGLPYKDIDSLIRQYCEQNGYSQETYHQYKFQLIDKTKLRAQQYKQIFLNDITKLKQQQQFVRQSMIRFPQDNIQSNDILGSRPMYQSMINPASNGNVSNELTLQMQNIFQKKLNEELQQQKFSLIEQMKKLKNSTASANQSNAELIKQLAQLKEKIKQYDKQERQQRQRLEKTQKFIKVMQNKLTDSDKLIKTLQNQVQTMDGWRCPKCSQDQSDIFVQSTIIPSHLIGDLMRKQPQDQKKKQQSAPKIAQSLDDADLQEKYSSRLQFDEFPVSVPKTCLPILVDILGPIGFNKMNMKLVFRRSDQHKAFGQQNDIRMRNPLVLFVRTGAGQIIGGYTSKTIPKNCQQYIADPKAFIFTLTKGKKFNVLKQRASEALYISDHYLIGFANDLMISKNCLDEQSYCDWSSSYEGNNKQSWGPKQFAGGSEFMIKDLQVYEVVQDSMEMVI